MRSNQSFLDQLFDEKNRQTGKGQIERALTELIGGKALTVMVGRSGGVLAEAALLHAETGAALILDELMPEAENARLLCGEDLLLWSTSMLPLGFQSTVIERLRWQYYGAVRIQWPDALYHLQRRAALRAVPAEADGMALSIHRHGARNCAGFCVDMGAGGMRARIQAPSDYPMTVGEMLAGVRFAFQGGAYRVEAQVRYVEPVRYPRGIATQDMGLRFVRAPGMLQERITQYALRCDRERLRGAHR